MNKLDIGWKSFLMAASCLNLVFSIQRPAFADEGDWKVVMTYAGGYSPIKEIRIEILKKDNNISFLAEKFYYDNTPSEKKEGEVPPEKFNVLVAELEKNEAWTLTDLTEYVATDGFTYKIEIQNGDKQHLFQVYFPELQKDKRYVNIANAISSIAGEL